MMKIIAHTEKGESQANEQERIYSRAYNRR